MQAWTQNDRHLVDKIIQVMPPPLQGQLKLSGGLVIGNSGPAIDVYHAGAGFPLAARGMGR